MNLTSIPWYYWLVALVLLASAWWFKKRADEVGQSRRWRDYDASASSGAATANASSSAASDATSTASSKGGTELVAVIAAAVAAASGMHPSQFRIAGITAIGSSGAAGSNGGWNTPVWGRVERFARPENHR